MPGGYKERRYQQRVRDERKAGPVEAKPRPAPLKSASKKAPAKAEASKKGGKK